MTFDNITIIIASLLILISIVSSLCNVFLRRPKRSIQNPKSSSLSESESNSQQESEHDDRHKVSIILTVHNNAQEIEKNLTHILDQEYEPGFEVIVVDESSSDDTDDILKTLKNKYSNLYTTFIPESTHYISRRKLALTLGVKAAKNEWLIFVDCDSRPESRQWLESMSRHFNDNTDIVIGYSRFSSETSDFKRFFHLLNTCYVMRCAQRSTAYRDNCHNLAFRKSLFMRHNGYLKNLKLLRGEYDFMVNEFAEKGHTDIAFEEDACLIKDEPYKKAWINTNVFYNETRRYLQRSKSYRLWFNIDMTMLHLNYLAIIATAIFSIMMQNWMIAIADALALIITISIRDVLAIKAARDFRESITWWKVPFMEIWVVWHNVAMLIRRIKSDKYDFIRK